MIDTEQQLVDGLSQEKANNIEKAIEIYLKIVNSNLRDIRAYDRITILYRKQKNYEKEISVILQALLVVMILGNRELSIENIHKIWEDIVDDLTIKGDVKCVYDKVLYMDIDSRLKFAKYIKRYCSANLLLQRRITKELRVETAQYDGTVISRSLPDNIHDTYAKEVNREVDGSEIPLDQGSISFAKNKKYAVYIILFLLLIWLIIEYPWILLCLGVVVFIIWSSSTRSGGNVRGHYKRNGTYVNSYNRRTRK